MKTGGLAGSPTVTKKKKKRTQPDGVAGTPVAQTAQEVDSDDSDTEGSVDDDTSETDTETEDEGDD